MGKFARLTEVRLWLNSPSRDNFVCRVRRSLFARKGEAAVVQVLLFLRLCLFYLGIFTSVQINRRIHPIIKSTLSDCCGSSQFRCTTLHNLRKSDILQTFPQLTPWCLVWSLMVIVGGSEWVGPWRGDVSWGSKSALTLVQQKNMVSSNF